MAKAETKQFPGAFSLLKPSFNALKLNIWTFLAFFAISVVFSIFSNDASSTDLTIFDLMSVVIGVIVAPALVVTQLRSADKKEISVQDALKQGWPFVIRIFLLQILSALIIIAGFILLIVPGVIAIQRLLLAQFYLVDRDMGVIDAIKASFADSKKYSGAVWGLIGVNIAYALLFLTIILIPFSIGLLVAYFCAPAIRYYQIQQAEKSA